LEEKRQEDEEVGSGKRMGKKDGLCKTHILESP
jgi:hypothetical protein